MQKTDLSCFVSLIKDQKWFQAATDNREILCTYINVKYYNFLIEL